MEAIIAIVGFLGAGKTTLLKHLITNYNEAGWAPYVVLNDYENAYMDSQQPEDKLDAKCIKALSGSCICCSGITELRESVNSVPKRDNGITLVEANGTSDACSLMGFLGVGVDERFLPPVQISVVDVKNWQLRGEHNELEANQVQVSSIIILTHLDEASEARRALVERDLNGLNPTATIMTMEELDITQLSKLAPSTNSAQPMEHKKAHWASCSVDLPKFPDTSYIHKVCKDIPKTILRVKGCTQIGDDSRFTYFERTPDGKVGIRSFNGTPYTGAKLLTVGPGSDPEFLNKIVSDNLKQTGQTSLFDMG